MTRPYRLTVRTAPSHGANPGSIPGGVTIADSASKQNSHFREFCVMLVTCAQCDTVTKNVNSILNIALSNGKARVTQLKRFPGSSWVE